MKKKVGLLKSYLGRRLFYSLVYTAPINPIQYNETLQAWCIWDYHAQQWVYLIGYSAHNNAKRVDIKRITSLAKLTHLLDKRIYAFPHELTQYRLMDNIMPLIDKLFAMINNQPRFHQNAIRKLANELYKTNLFTVDGLVSNLKTFHREEPCYEPSLKRIELVYQLPNHPTPLQINLYDDLVVGETRFNALKLFYPKTVTQQPLMTWDILLQEIKYNIHIRIPQEQCDTYTIQNFHILNHLLLILPTSVRRVIETDMINHLTKFKYEELKHHYYKLNDAEGVPC